MPRRKSKSYLPCIKDIRENGETRSLQYFCQKHGVSTRVGQSLQAMGYISSTRLPMRWISEEDPSEEMAAKVKEYASQMKYKPSPAPNHKTGDWDVILEEIPVKSIADFLRRKGFEVSIVQVIRKEY